MRRLSYLPAAQWLGQRLGHLGKRLFGRTLDLVLPVPPNQPVESIENVHRVLLVRPNFRIGNTLITSPLVPALRQRFPDARLDYLAGDTTATLLAHLPVDEVYCVSRKMILRPWRFVALFARLRREAYDVSIEAGMGSFSGGLYSYLCGARYRVGCSGSGDRFLNVRVPRIKVSHAYDSPPVFARSLGVTCPDLPVYEVSAVERAEALRLLAQLGLAEGGVVFPFAALFIGGHREKRWPADRWLGLGKDLGKEGARLLIFLGPEEVHLEDRLRRELPAGARILRPQPLRVFAALCAAAHLIVTPDSGPMHLAVALHVPTIALIQLDRSLRYAPREGRDRVLVRPSAAEVVTAVTTHPCWRALAPG